MAGERTIFRVYVDGNGDLCYQILTKDSDTRTADLYLMLERAQQELLEESRTNEENDDMTDDEVDGVRNLLDKKDENNAP